MYFYYEEKDDDNVNKCSVSVHLSFHMRQSSVRTCVIEILNAAD